MSGRNALCVCPKGVEIVAKLNNNVLPCTEPKQEIWNSSRNLQQQQKPTPAALSPSNHTDMNISYIAFCAFYYNFDAG